LDDACTLVNPRAESILRFGTEVDEIESNNPSLSKEEIFEQDRKEKRLIGAYPKPTLINKYWNQFLKIIATLPKIQRQFLIVAYDQDKWVNKSISQKVHERKNDFGRFIRKQTDKSVLPFNRVGRIIPSVGMYQSRVKAIY